MTYSTLPFTHEIACEVFQAFLPHHGKDQAECILNWRFCSIFMNFGTEPEVGSGPSIIRVFSFKIKLKVTNSESSLGTTSINF